MTAQDLQLGADDQIHRQWRRCLGAREQSDLHVPTTLAQAPQRIDDDRSAAECVDRHVGATGGDLEHGRSDVVCRGVDHGLGTERHRDIQRRPRHVHRDDPGAAGCGDHDRRETHAPAAVHRDPVARGHVAELDDSTVGGAEPAPEARCGVEAHRIGDPHQIGLRPADRDELRERSPVREAGLELAVTHLVVAAQAGRARAAGTHERRRHDIAGYP